MNLLRNIMLCCSLTAALASMAVPARRGTVVTLTKPDGREITVELHGDEAFNYMTTTDGIPVVVGDDGSVTYAIVGDDGILRTTGVEAFAPADRDASRQAYVNSLDRRAVSRAIESASLGSPRRRAAAVPRKNNPGLVSSSFVAKGSMPALVVLVEFSNLKFTIDNPNEYFDRLCNEPGFSDNGATGSVRDYFYDNSLGAFEPKFKVYGPVTLDNTMKYYGENDMWGNDKRAHEMAIHACRKLCDEDGVDFSPFDFDNDGYVDNVYVFYAGRPASNDGGANSVWPHSWDISYSGIDYGDDIVLGDKKIEHYACSSEYSGGTTPDGIGSMVHEFSHVLGLPDLYSTDSYLTCTPGDWSVLDQGCYNNDSRTPAGYSMFERYALDWAKPRHIGDPAKIRLQPVSDGAGCIYEVSDNEYFLVENRVAEGWDEHLPAEGMLVWHIDYNAKAWDYNEVNNYSDHQRVDLMEADGAYGPFSLKGDPFPGSQNITEAILVPWLEKDQDRWLGLAEIEKNGREINFTVVNSSSAIESPELGLGEPSVSVDGCRLSVSVAAPSELIVTDIAGRVVAAVPVAAGETSLDLPGAGVYVVRVDSHICKIAVR